MLPPLRLGAFKSHANPASASTADSLAKARCLGKGAATDFLYDLSVGTDEGSVNVILTLDNLRYCTAFDDFRGRNGSDGKRFQGKDAPPPAACPPLGGP